MRISGWLVDNGSKEVLESAVRGRVNALSCSASDQAVLMQGVASGVALFEASRKKGGGTAALEACFDLDTLYAAEIDVSVPHEVRQGIERYLDSLPGLREAMQGVMSPGRRAIFMQQARALHGLLLVSVQTLCRSTEELSA